MWIEIVGVLLVGVALGWVWVAWLIRRRDRAAVAAHDRDVRTAQARAALLATRTYVDASDRSVVDPARVPDVRDRVAGVAPRPGTAAKGFARRR